jgi:hypothetical protein
MAITPEEIAARAEQVKDIFLNLAATKGERYVDVVEGMYGGFQICGITAMMCSQLMKLGAMTRPQALAMGEVICLMIDTINADLAKLGGLKGEAEITDACKHARKLAETSQFDL